MPTGGKPAGKFTDIYTRLASESRTDPLLGNELVSQGCPSEGPAVSWANRLPVNRFGILPPTLCEQERLQLHPRGVSESFTCQREVRLAETGRTRHCLSQWRDEASYGNPRGCQPGQAMNPANPTSFFEARGCRHSIGWADSSPSSAESGKNDPAEPHGGLEPTIPGSDL